MSNQEITDKYYQEAVKDLNETILEEGDLWYSYVIHLPVHLQAIYTIGVLHQQVLNGGFHQYFLNGYGQFIYLALEYLRLIDASNTASVVEKALNEVNSEQLDVDEFRKKVFSKQIKPIVDFDDDLGDRLNDLDDEYYSLTEDIEHLYIDYLNRHSLN